MQSFLRKGKILESVLESHGMNHKTVWAGRDLIKMIQFPIPVIDRDTFQ